MNIRFEEACAAVTGQKLKRESIGTYQEKSVHAALKLYFQPDSGFHEQKVSGYVADICFGDEIYEIQTKAFRYLRKKLDVFLQEYQVTVVYPISFTKWIYWIDPDTGEVAERRKSPKKGRAQFIFPELYQLRTYLHHPSLRFCILLLEVEEYRLLDGYGTDRKKRSTRYDRVPVRLEQEIWLRQPSDYQKLLPAGLPESFTAKEFAKKAGIPVKTAQTGLQLLTELSVVERIGKSGQAYVYHSLFSN